MTSGELSRIVAALASVMALCAPGAGRADEPSAAAAGDAAAGVSVPLDRLPEVMPPAEVIEVAKRLMVAGQADPARRLLERVLPQAPDPIEVRFLLGTIAVGEKRYPVLPACGWNWPGRCS
jgi:hypothetical protein